MLIKLYNTLINIPSNIEIKFYYKEGFILIETQNTEAKVKMEEHIYLIAIDEIMISFDREEKTLDLDSVLGLIKEDLNGI